MKTCRICGRRRKAEEFTRGKAVCRECRAEEARERRHQERLEARGEEQERPYLPPREWQKRIETWRHVNEWRERRGLWPYDAPDAKGGALEQIRARLVERTYRELVLPWESKHGAGSSS